MKPILAEIGASVRDVLRITFVIPVRDGRPHPRAWPHGLRELGTATAAVFILLALSILFAVPLRQWSQVALTPTAPAGVPQVTLPLLLTAVILSLAMIVTASLHASWWLRILLLVIGGATVTFFAGQAIFSSLWLAISVLAYLAVVGFAMVRSFRSYAWWEFPVVTGLLMVSTLAPWLQPMSGASFGPTALHGSLLSLQDLILPAVMVAGSAPAQIVVTGAQAAADRPVGTGLFWTGFGVAVVWLGIATGLAAGTTDLNWSAIGGSAVVFALVAATVAVLLRRSRVKVPPPPETYPEVWGSWLYPLATAVAAVVAFSLPLAILLGILQRVGSADAAAAIAAAWDVFNSNSASLWRGLLGSVTLVLAWRLAGRARLAEAVTLGTFAVLVLTDAVGQVARVGFLNDRTATAFGLLAAVIALGSVAVEAVRRRLDRSRAVGVMTVVLLAVLYPQRNLIENPLGALLALTPSVLLIFGLAWRVVTEAQFTYASSPKYPQSTRVLLYLANTLFATTGVAYVALARASGTSVDPSAWGVLGDRVLGEPLYVAGLVTGLWLVLRPAGRPVTQPAEPSYSPTS